MIFFTKFNPQMYTSNLVNFQHFNLLMLVYLYSFSEKCSGVTLFTKHVAKVDNIITFIGFLYKKTHIILFKIIYIMICFAQNYFKKTVWFWCNIKVDQKVFAQYWRRKKIFKQGRFLFFCLIWIKMACKYSYFALFCIFGYVWDWSDQNQSVGLQTVTVCLIVILTNHDFLSSLYKGQ